MQIVHATSVHPRTDTRIWVKMCQSAKEAGHHVTLVVADGLGSAQGADIQILDVLDGDGAPRNNRLKRLSFVARRVMQTALNCGADIVHFHDPELLPHAAVLRSRKGPFLIFDAHEDVPKQILGKHYLPRWSRPLVSGGYSLVERAVASKVDAVVTATPTITSRYRRIHPRVETIANFPRRTELLSDDLGTGDRAGVCYVGGISSARGIQEMVDALQYTESNASLYLAGRFPSVEFREEVAQSQGWGRVQELGFLDRDAVRRLLGRVSAGLVTLHPTPAYIDAFPTKMFEYMSAGVPVIASGFPVWKQFVEGECCGLCVDPRDSKDIAKAIDELVLRPENARQMGRNGQLAVEREYNWESQAGRLLDLYAALMSAGRQ